MFYARTPTPLTAETRPLASGFAGVRQTVALMRSLVNRGKVNPDIRTCAASIIFNQIERDGLGEVCALFEYVRDFIRYTQDVAGVETIQSPDKTLEFGYGDCDDQSVLLAALLESVGYPTRFVVTGYSVPGELEHVYLETVVDGNRVPMDPTERECFGFEFPGAISVYYEPV